MSKAREDPSQLVEPMVRFMTDRASDDAWAHRELYSLVQRDPDAALRIVLEVLRRVPAERIPAVAAGPLEDVVFAAGALFSTGDDSLLREIEATARTDMLLREALASVWPAEQDPPELWSRIDAVVGSPVHERHPPRKREAGDA
jgi:hypothetical protein